MRKTATFDVYRDHKTGKTRRATGEVYKESGLTVWVYMMEAFDRKIIKRHKIKHAVEFI